MAVSKEKVLELLGSGLSNDIVATAVGCDSSYISQLLADEEFATAVSTLRMSNLTAHNKRDKSIDSIEDRLIEKLSEIVDGPQLFKPREVLQAFAVLNSAKRRGVPAHEGVVVNNTIVNLQIPQRVVQNFVVNGTGEVVEVEGQTLVTMPAGQLLKKLAADTAAAAALNNKPQGQNTYEKVSRYLPSAGGDTSSNESNL